MVVSSLSSLSASLAGKQIKLLDFGLAEVVGARVMRNGKWAANRENPASLSLVDKVDVENKGTAAYKAPELADDFVKLTVRQALLLDMHVVPRWAVYLQLGLPLYNACYFGKQAVANYAVHYMLGLLGQDELIRQRIEQRTSYITGEEVMAWKDAVAVPQRGS